MFLLDHAPLTTPLGFAYPPHLSISLALSAHAPSPHLAFAVILGLQIEVHRSSVPLIIFLVAVFGTIILLLRFALDKVLALINLLLASTKLWMGVCVVSELIGGVHGCVCGE